MRRFRFRLQAILDLRRHEEEQRRLELGAATGRRNAIQNAIDDGKRRRHAALRSQPETVGRDDIAWRLATEDYAYRLSVEIKRLEQRLLEAERERESVAELYGVAKQKADVLQRLRDRREKNHLYEQRRDEQYRLDEVSQQIYSRGGN
ncbi:MAG: flagellar FliJ family protein [Alkalispirochaeta sp.]